MDNDQLGPMGTTSQAALAIQKTKDLQPIKDPQGGPMVCGVDGCGQDLAMAPAYNQRHRACCGCIREWSVVHGGIKSRFCQQCAKFEPEHQFDKGRRSCRTMLQKHSARRRCWRNSPEPVEQPAKRHPKQPASTKPAKGGTKKAATSKPRSYLVMPRSGASSAHLALNLLLERHTGGQGWGGVSVESELSALFDDGPKPTQQPGRQSEHGSQTELNSSTSMSWRSTQNLPGLLHPSSPMTQTQPQPCPSVTAWTHSATTEPARVILDLTSPRCTPSQVVSALRAKEHPSSSSTSEWIMPHQAMAPGAQMLDDVEQEGLPQLQDLLHVDLGREEGPHDVWDMSLVAGIGSESGSGSGTCTMATPATSQYMAAMHVPSPNMVAGVGWHQQHVPGPGMIAPQQPGAATSTMHVPSQHLQPMLR